MARDPETSDGKLLNLLRLRSAMSVSEMAAETGVTATAVRQRLTRLMGERLIERNSQRSGRGRPSHYYSLTRDGLRAAGTNYDDLAETLWEEIRAIEDPQTRRGLLARIATRLSQRYAGKLQGADLAERMESLVKLMGERDVPLEVDKTSDSQLPVLNVLACPYPDLAAADRGVCAMEKMMLAEVLGSDLRLTDCRLDGGSICTFAAS